MAARPARPITSPRNSSLMDASLSARGAKAKRSLTAWRSGRALAASPASQRLRHGGLAVRPKRLAGDPARTQPRHDDAAPVAACQHHLGAVTAVAEASCDTVPADA